MRNLILILLVASLAAGCGEERKSDNGNEAVKNAPSRPPAGLKPMGSPHTSDVSMPPGHGMGEMPALPTPEAPKGMDFSGLEKAPDGYRIEELFAQRAELAGKVVKIRGRVVKFSPEIMGTNWLHVQDGTGAPGSNDLTVTTSVALSVGDTVLIEGPLTVDQVLGHGMKYPVLIQGATLVVDPDPRPE